tara:strand:+ start:776 stop:1723 length:948 start_codon:yes stop_codon:yes gene_type:complete
MDETREDAPAVLKEHDGPHRAEDDAMSHLLKAYRLMIDHPECAPLLKPLMKVIHSLEVMMVEQLAEDLIYDIEYDMKGKKKRPYYAQKVIDEVDGQFCVLSEETGRSFGCYDNVADAEARLAQIESFADKNLTDQSHASLKALHDMLTNRDWLTPEMVVLRDLVGDEITLRPAEVIKEASSVYAVYKQDDRRYTMGPVYVPDLEDAHGEFTDRDTLQKALWDWVRKGDRTIYLQHSEKAAGEMVEVLTWPFKIETELAVPNQGVTKYAFPADTPFMGVIWDDWAWDLVKAGELRGYSIGGKARRVEADLPDAALV